MSLGCENKTLEINFLQDVYLKYLLMKMGQSNNLCNHKACSIFVFLLFCFFCFILFFVINNIRRYIFLIIDILGACLGNRRRHLQTTGYWRSLQTHLRHWRRCKEQHQINIQADFTCKSTVWLLMVQNFFWSLPRMKKELLSNFQAFNNH